MNILSAAGHLYREMSFRTHARRAGKYRCLFFVGDSCPGSSAGLRAVQLADSLRCRGWGAEVVPHQLSLTQRRRIIQWYRPHVLVFQKARHPLNRVGYYDGLPVVFDIDDADYLDPNCNAQVQECAEMAHASVAGSGHIAQYLRRYCKDVSTIWTGAKMIPVTPERPESGTSPIIVWASSSLNGYQAEADFLQNVLLKLADTQTFRFALIGKSSELWLSEYFAPLERMGVACQHHPFMPYDELIRLVSSFDIGVAPLRPDLNAFSSGKSFGKILVYLNAGLAVLASDAVDHSLAFGEGGAMVVDSEDEWCESLKRLLSDHAFRRMLARQGRQVMKERLSIDSFADQYEQVLLRVMQKGKTQVA